METLRAMLDAARRIVGAETIAADGVCAHAAADEKSAEDIKGGRTHQRELIISAVLEAGAV